MAHFAAATRSAREATEDELVAEGGAIWQEVRAAAVPEDDEAGCAALLERLHGGSHHDFAVSFPLVLRWMVQARRFSARALRDFLRRRAAAPADTREAYLRLQVEYPVALRREELREGPRHSGEETLGQYREALVEALLAEDAAFAEATRRAEADLSRETTTNAQERRRLLYEHLCARLRPQ